MSEEKVEINDSFIDRKYFEDNVEEAKKYKWRVPDSKLISDHQHCIICLRPIKIDAAEIYVTPKLWLCNFCYNNFVKEEGLS